MTTQEFQERRLDITNMYNEANLLLLCFDITGGEKGMRNNDRQFNKAMRLKKQARIKEKKLFREL